MRSLPLAHRSRVLQNPKRKPHKPSWGCRVVSALAFFVALLAVVSPALAQSFSYDSRGRLRSVRTYEKVYTYVYDGLDNLAAICDLSVDPPCSHVVIDETGGEARVLAIVKENGDAEMFAYGPTGVLARQVITAGVGAVQPALIDRNGSIRGYTNNQGEIVARFAYDAFGRTRAQKGGPSALGHAGEMVGPDGSIWLRSRFYRPHIGRFLQRDRSQPREGDMTVMSRAYSYAHANPASQSDNGFWVQCVNDVGHCAGNFFIGLLHGGANYAAAMGPGIVNTLTTAVNGWGYIGQGVYGTFTGTDPSGRPLIPFELKPVQADDLGFSVKGNPFAEAGSDTAQTSLLLVDIGLSLTGKPPTAPTKGPKLFAASKPRATPTSARKGFAPDIPCSFDGETPVFTSEGLKKIADIRPGAWVLSEDTERGERAYRQVVELFATPGEDVIELTVDGPSTDPETLRVTPNHPFFVKNRGYVPVEDLRPGEDELYSERGEWLTLTSLVASGDRSTMYNLDVAEFDTFFVGETGTLVHNSCSLPRYDGPKPTYHVNEAHVPGPKFNPKKEVLPRDAAEVYKTAVPDAAEGAKHWYGKNADGIIYRFMNANDGTAHFSGSSATKDGIRNITPYARQRLDGK